MIRGFLRSTMALIRGFLFVVGMQRQPRKSSHRSKKQRPRHREDSITHRNRFGAVHCRFEERNKTRRDIQRVRYLESVVDL